MRKSFMIVAAVAAMSFLMAGNRAVAQDNMKYVEVTAKVDKQVVPDELMLNVTVYEKDLKKPQTLESVERAAVLLRCEGGDRSGLESQGGHDNR